MVSFAMWQDLSGPIGEYLGVKLEDGKTYRIGDKAVVTVSEQRAWGYVDGKPFFMVQSDKDIEDLLEFLLANARKKQH